MKTRLKVAAVVCALASSFGGTARAQGIPTIDLANLIQAIQQVLNDTTKISNQVQQLTQLQRQLDSLTGTRNLGNISNNVMLKNYVPAEAYTSLNAVSNAGYAGLNPSAKALRDSGMVYNCMDLTGNARTSCQAALAQPYQHKGLLQDAMKAASGRLSQIQSLMDQVDATTDQKSVQEVQARIGAENAMLSHEISQVLMLQAMADSEERIARSRDRERQREMLSRTGKVADYLR